MGRVKLDGSMIMELNSPTSGCNLESHGANVYGLESTISYCVLYNGICTQNNIITIIQ